MVELSKICKNCGYSKGVHSTFNYQCPLGDPFVQEEQKDFDLDSFFEPEEDIENEH